MLVKLKFIGTNFEQGSYVFAREKNLATVHENSEALNEHQWITSVKAEWQKHNKFQI